MPPRPSPNTVQKEKPAAKVGRVPPAAVAKPKQPNQPGAKPDDLKPPDEQFWQRYSPNGEPFLSGLSSFVIHGVVLAGILLGVLAWFKSSSGDEEIEPVLIGDGQEGGGGGNLQGEGAGPQLSKKDDVNENLDKKDNTPMPDTPMDDVKIKTDTTPKLADDPDNVDLVNQMKKKKPAATAGVFLKDALEGLTGKGGGGTGFGGGTGSGRGKGTGAGEGDGTGKTNRRGRRVLRWTVNFNTTGGEDYVRQLAGLGAIIGVPDTKGTLMVIRNLTERPVKPAYEDIKAINRIFWVDDREESARNVAQALLLDVIPKQLVAFFPESIEKQLLETELAFGKPRGRKTEEDITETVFNVSFRAGKPVFTVVSQRGR